MGRTVEAWSMALGVLGFTFGLAPGVRALPDKLDGTLEFLVSLPVAAGTMARAHLLACAGYGLLAAPAWTAAILMALPSPEGGAWRVGAVGVVLSAVWVGATVLSGLAAGMLVRFDFEGVGWLPGAIFLGLLSLGAIVERLWPGMDAALVTWLTAPPSAAHVGAIAGAASVLGLGTAYGLLRSGFARFRPSRGALGEAQP